MNVKATELKQSSCTSCGVTQDKSAYWTPSLHFLFPNGTAVIVPQVGGMLAYYLLRGNDYDSTKGKVTAFPDGFQMLAGNKFRRNFTLPVPDPPTSKWTADEKTQAALREKAIGFNCLDYDKVGEQTLSRHSMPNKAFLDGNCKHGLRLELMFPSCWNGKDLDSADHKSHMAYPDFVMDGICPKGYDVKLPSLLYETIWNTYAFKGVDGQFVLSNGDPTGNSYHGDFMMGWDSSDFLQKAVDTCKNMSGDVKDCPLFTLQSDNTAAQCTFPVPSAVADDNVPGPRQGLPVSVPIQSGPANATPYSIYGQISTSTGSTTSAAAVTTTANPPTPKLGDEKLAAIPDKYKKKKHHKSKHNKTVAELHYMNANAYPGASTVSTTMITSAGTPIELIVLATPTTITVKVERVARDCTTTTSSADDNQALETPTTTTITRTRTTTMTRAAPPASTSTAASASGPVNVGVEGGDGTGVVVINERGLDALMGLGKRMLRRAYASQGV